MTDSTAIITEPREALRYVAEPLVASIEEMPQVVGDAFARVEAWLGARGTALSPGVLRYTTARADGSFAIEVGHIVEGDVSVDAPFVAGELPAGTYTVARHTGPYMAVGDVTRALMESWGPAGVEPASARTSTGDDYASWYELYTDVPTMGPNGPEGTVEVCVLVLPASS
ncbi:MAG: GyrI-like domain-containing protein [Actinomycetes bacterium]